MRQGSQSTTIFAIVWVAAVLYACGGGSFAGASKSKKAEDSSNGKSGSADAGDGKGATSGGGEKDGNDGGTAGTAGTAGTSGKDSKDGTLDGGADAPDGKDPADKDGKDAKDGKDDDGLTDGDSNTTKLLQPIKIDQTHSDCEAEIYVSRIDDKGNKGPEQVCKFGDDKTGSCELADVCHKTQDTTIETRWKLCGNNITVAVTGSVKRIAGGANTITVTVDEEEDGKCLIGSCIDPGKDNTIVYTCPNGAKVLTIQGLQ